MSLYVRIEGLVWRVVVAALATSACGDDATDGSGGATSASTIQGDDDGASTSSDPDGTTGSSDANPSTTGTGGGVLECSEAMSEGDCAAAGNGSCRWLTSYFLPENGASCALDQPHAGACVDYTTSDGCNVGPCGPPTKFGGTFELFYRMVDGGFEVVQAEDCNPMLEGFSVCPFDPLPDSPFFCDCLCTPDGGTSGTDG